MEDDFDGHYNEKQSEKDKKAKGGGSSKSKDLSHVPCKFFKVGSCTAGSSCPFSHHALEPGQQKDVCAWFVKGNCKFGHKCALAHILPGQSMSMDRRNKKAAQQAAAQAGKEGGVGPRDRDRDRDKDRERGDKLRSQRATSTASGASSNNVGPQRPSSTQARTGLLTGSTAPTRVLTTGTRPPLPISKAVPAPAAPAPTLKDADFATSVDTPKSPTETITNTETTSADAGSSEANENAPSQADPKLVPEQKETSTPTTIPAPVGSPPSAAPVHPIASPTQPVRFSGRHGSKPSVDFGPIGSPPRSSPASRINGFSPGTSPRDGAVVRPPPIISGSPFSAPGSQSLFMPFERPDALGGSMDATRVGARSGLAMSLGATRTLAFGSSTGHRAVLNEDEDGDANDLEEFVPSSLTDLLTPEEQNRRMSRASSGKTGTGLVAVATQGGIARSVPATSVLGDLRSIWSDTRADAPVGRTGPDVLGGTLGVGSPSSFNSASGLAARVDGPSPSLLSPSNASAAFLPGLHHHYLSRPPPGVGAGRGINATFANNATQQGHGAFGNLNGHGISASPSRIPGESIHAHHANHHQSIHDILSSSPSHALHQHHLPTGRPIPSKGFLNADLPISPSARALQAHAPGQSLPQGLAAGYSRIHVQPPPNIPSPSTSGAAFSPPGLSGLHQTTTTMEMFGHQEWGTAISGGAGLGANGNGGVGVSMGVGVGAISGGGSSPGIGFHQQMHANSGTGLPSQNQAGLQQLHPVPAGSDLKSGISGTGTPPTSGGPGFENASSNVAAPAPGAPGTSATPSAGDRGDVGGLTTMFSRLSYSAAAARGTGGAMGGSTNPASIARKTSGHGPGGAQRWSSHPMSSPLSGPVLTNDDDVLFNFEE